jgi:hypothetical protein
LKTNIGEKHYVFCIFHRVRSFRYHKEIVLSLHVEYERRSIVWLSNFTRTNDLEPMVHSQYIRTFFFHPSTHYVFRTITELIGILYIVFFFCHIILNTHSTRNKFMYFEKMCRQMIISSLIILNMNTFRKQWFGLGLVFKERFFFA